MAHIETRPGGQAANVAAWAAELGADARLVGRRGDDATGQLLAQTLREREVELCGPATGRTGVVVSLAAAGDRTVASGRGAATEREREAIGELDTRWVLKRGARGLTVDGRDHAAVAVDVVDATGAGDALAAGFLVGGPELGLATAARCCAQLGAMP